MAKLVVLFDALVQRKGFRRPLVNKKLVVFALASVAMSAAPTVWAAISGRNSYSVGGGNITFKRHTVSSDPTNDSITHVVINARIVDAPFVSANISVQSEVIFEAPTACQPGEWTWNGQSTSGGGHSSGTISVRTITPAECLGC